MIHITNNTPDPVYFEGTHIAPGCSYIINPNTDTDMNAEQLARDIKSLDQAHRAADEALKPYPGLSIGAKVESLSKEFVKLGQRPVETPHLTEDERLEIRKLLAEALGTRACGTLGLVKKIVDLCTSLKLNNKSLTESYEALKAEQGNNISLACSQATHNQLNRVLPRSLNRLDVRVKELVDELLKLREDPSLKEIREIVSKALGYSHEAISGTTTAGLVEMLARGCKDMQDHGFLEKLHREFDRAEPRYLGGVIERARRAVDELLKLRQQGETNNSRLEEEDRLEIREKLITALGCGRFTSTVAMVDLVLGELQHTRAEAASDTAKNFNASILRLKAKADFEELKQEHQKLSEKHQELYSNYKLLQALSIGQPKGLAPKEKWEVYPIGGPDSYRVMRGNEDATPHPVSKAVAEAIAWELNGR